MEAAMNGPRNLLFLGTLALAAALLTTTSLTTYAAEAAPAGAGGEAGPPLAANITVPTDPIAKAAFDALDAHCARSHQDGMLVHRKSAEKNFGFVLQFDKLAGDPNFIVPGNPDAS